MLARLPLIVCLIKLQGVSHLCFKFFFQAFLAVRGLESVSCLTLDDVVRLDLMLRALLLFLFIFIVDAFLRQS